MTLYGSGFATGVVVQWTPTGGASGSLPTTYVSATQIVAQVPASFLAKPGTASLTATNPDGSISNAWPVNVVARPVITQSDPNDGGVRITIAVGAAAFPATLYGTGFGTASIVQWVANGGQATSLSTTYVSATQIVAQVPASLFTAIGSAGLMVRNPDGSTSNVWTVIVAEALPSLSSITPNSALVGSPALSVSVTGSGFYAGSVIYFNQTALQTTVAGPSSATVLCPRDF